MFGAPLGAYGAWRESVQAFRVRDYDFIFVQLKCFTSRHME